MAQATRTFRVFVSSTFNDLKEERNALQRDVFPRLRKLCFENGMRFQAIDLRWGVREEAGLDQRTMAICLDEIARCRQVSPRPNFIVLLGDRYGWRPLPAAIPSDEFDAIRRCITPEADARRLETWYRRDDNAVPPEVCLMPRKVDLSGCRTDQEREAARSAEAADWSQTEKALRGILLAAIGRAKLTDTQRAKYETSATEQEIESGALRVDDASEHVFCFFRRITNLPRDATANDFCDLDERGHPDTTAEQRLDQLKERLRTRLPQNIREYEATWVAPCRVGSFDMLDGHASTGHLAGLCEDAFQALSGVVRAEMTRLGKVDALSKEIEAHDSFGRARARLFVGRASLLQAIADYGTKSDRKPLAVHGVSGSGKSAAIAKAAEELHRRQPGAVVVCRFIGATAESSNVHMLLESLCREISRRYGADERSVPSDYQDLIQEFPKRLALAAADRPLIVFLDALDQLSDIDHGRNLIWLPADIPEHVRLIISTLPGECLLALERKLPVKQRIELGPMPLREAATLLDYWLANAGRCLQARQQTEVLNRFSASGLPLYLKLAFEEARHWKSFTQASPLSADIPGIISDMFARLSLNSNHGALMVSRSLGYLAASKNGLSEDELLDVLSLDDDVLQDFADRSRHTPPERRLPVIVWSRLYFDLEPYLTEQVADGASLLAFYHRQLREVVEHDFLAGAAAGARHRSLSAYFSKRALYEREGGPASLRKLAELPYHQMHGELWNDLEGTLTDLEFIQAKFGAERALELIGDYVDALAAASPEWPGRGRVEEFSRLVQSQPHVFQPEAIPSFKPAITKPTGREVFVTKTFRLYIASTFSDFLEERNALTKFVFPRLRALCAEYGCRFEVPDMRWGIRQESALDQRTMKIALSMAGRCQFSLVLLGDRLGWRPLPEEIPAAEFEDILVRVQDTCERQLLEQWYCRDDNAVPPVYCLRPRRIELERGAGDEERHQAKEQEPWKWSQVESRLRSLLTRTVCQMPLPPEKQLKYFGSVIEQEIAASVFRASDASGVTLGCFRTIQDLPENQLTQAFRNVDEYGRPDMEARQRLMRLKALLREQLPGNIYEYHAQWTEDRITKDHIEILCEDVFEFFSHAVLRELERLQYVDSLDDELARHRAFAADKAKYTMGQEPELDVLQAYIEGSDRHPLALLAEPGSGTPGFMAVAADRAGRSLGSGAEVVVRFIGATPGSTDGRELLEGLCREVARRFGLAESTVPKGYQELIRDFRAHLALASVQHRLVLFIDGLDQLRGSARNLSWLPTDLPEFVRMIVSVSAGGLGPRLQQRLSASNLVTVRPPGMEAGAGLLDRWLKEAGRTLRPHQRDEVLRKFESCGLPLYLRFAFEEARNWRSYDPAPELGPDTRSLIDNLFLRLSKEHGNVMVSRSLAYLAAAKYGLTQDELLDVLSADEDVFEDFMKHSYHVPPERRLPIVVWLRLYFDLEAYLIERVADTTVTMALFHRQLAEAARNFCLADDLRRGSHRRLARYFAEAPLEMGHPAARVRSLRKLSELPFQLANAELREELEQTLTDLGFVGTKCSAGRVQDLIADYALASPDLDDSSPAAGALSEFGRFIKNQSHVLGAYPALLFQQAMNQPDASAPFSVAQQKAGSVPGPWLQWLNKPQRRDPSVSTFLGHLGWVTACAWSPEGSMILSASSDRTLKLWLVETGEEVITLSGHKRAVNGCAWSPNTRRVASASDDQTLRIWDAETGEELFALSGHRGPVRACAWSPDATRLLSASQDGTVRIWDAKSGAELQTLRGHGGPVNACAWSPDSRQVASASDDKTVRVWDAETGEATRVLCGHNHYVLACAWSPDGRRVVSGSWDGTLRIWDALSGRELMSLTGSGGAVKACAWSPDGKLILAGSSDKTLRAWRVDTGKEQWSLDGHAGTITCCAWLPNQKRIVSGSIDETVKIWDASPEAPSALTSRHAEAVRAVSWSQAPARIATASDDNTLKLWDGDTWAPISTISGHTSSVTACAWSPDGSRLASAGNDRTVRLWDGKTGAALGSLFGHTHWATSCAWSPDGRRLASASYDATVKIWDAQTGAEMAALSDFTAIEACSWSPDGICLVSGGWDGLVKLWDPATAGLNAVLRGHSDAVTACAWSPEGHRIVSASRDGSLRIWDVFGCREIAILTGHAAEVRACAWSPDGRFVLSGSSDNTLLIWDAAAASIVATFVAMGDVNAVAFGKGGRFIVAGDGLGALYRLEVHGIEFG